MYTHWQPGTLIRVVCGVVLTVLVIGVLPVLDGIDGMPLLVLGVAAGLLIFILVCFHGLGTEVAAGRVEVWFGPGWIRKVLAASEIHEVSQVRNGVRMGWGIHWIGHRATLWNVSGLDAVELELRSGRRFRIGTDDPAGLAAAVRGAIQR